jgi:hypothetical protein
MLYDALPYADILDEWIVCCTWKFCRFRPVLIVGWNVGLYTFVELEEVGQEVFVICFKLNCRGEKLAFHCPEGGSNRESPKYRPQASPHAQIGQTSF